MPRPSPFLLHGWLLEWWRHFGAGGELAVHVARRDGSLVGALPLSVRRHHGMRRLQFVGGGLSALADLLLGPSEQGEVATALAEHATRGAFDYADLFGLPAGSRLGSALEGRIRLVERAEAPVVDLSPGWELVYRERTSSRTRNLHRRRRRQLCELGRLESTVARSPDDLASALEEAFALHALRWQGRPDRSGFAEPRGVAFHRAAIRALSVQDVPRILMLRLDGRPVAFHYYFVLGDAMVTHRLAFDPSLGRYSPGLLATLDAVEAAAAEGVTRVEFLGGAERYKVELADRLEPLHQGVGLAKTARGRLGAAAAIGSIRLRLAVKRSPALRRAYYEGLRPLRRALGRRGP